MTSSYDSSNDLLRSIGKAFLEAQEQNEQAKDLLKLLTEQVAILTVIAQKETDSEFLSQLVPTQTLLERYKAFLDNRSSYRRSFIDNLSYIAEKTQS